MLVEAGGCGPIRWLAAWPHLTTPAMLGRDVSLSVGRWRYIGGRDGFGSLPAPQTE